MSWPHLAWFLMLPEVALSENGHLAILSSVLTSLFFICVAQILTKIRAYFYMSFIASIYLDMFF